MRVLKRDGSDELVSFDKVLRRIENLANAPYVLEGIDAASIAQKVCGRIYDGVKTCELDELAAQMCASLVTEHPDYGTLAARVVVSNHHKNTSPSFSETISLMFNAKDCFGKPNPLITDELYNTVHMHKEKLNTIIDYARDYDFDYFGFKTLERSYLARVDNKIVERPQHLWMRVALGIHGTDIKDAIETYECMSSRKFTHATPTLFNAGMRNGSLASCFLYEIPDSIKGMYEALGRAAEISKHAGGIGVHIHDVRARGSYIRGTNGTSTGIVPYLRVLNNTARHVNQGSKRLGSIAVYLEPWHADIETFLDLRKNHGNEEERCRDLFLALWIPDLFMKRVEANEEWALMCPDESPGLANVYGAEFDELYLRYEAEGRYRKKVKAQVIWTAILKSQIETGTPYMLYKDACNIKSNQKNIGTIRSSNLCTEIIEYSDTKEIATCNLASIALASFVVVDPETGAAHFNYSELHRIAGIVTKNINKVIDRTYYPVPETKLSNKRHRPMGIGVQGLADTFAMLRMAYDSPEAALVNRDIFETIYHGAMTASVAIARKRSEMIDAGIKLEDQTEEEAALTEYKGAYTTFVGSPLSEGKFQFDLWGKPAASGDGGRWDWEALRTEVMKYGARNSLLLAPMPTASTSQILGFNEAFEAFNSNIYQRRTLAGEFSMINKYLIRDLLKLGLWDTDLKNRILAGSGSIQHIEEIPADIRVLYKTVWEIRQKVLIDLAADRGAYICQSQSLNLFVEDADLNKVTNMHFYAWKRGLKTGIYYLRTRPRAKTMAFTIDPSVMATAQRQQSEMAAKNASNANNAKPRPVCDTLDEDGACLMCSS